MKKFNFNLWSFVLLIATFVLLGYHYFSVNYHGWIIISPEYIMPFVSLVFVLVFILGMIGLKDRDTRLSKLRSVTTLALSSLAMIILLPLVGFAILLAPADSTELIETSVSPDGDYTVEFYLIDPGVEDVTVVRGEINGPLWWKKYIYREVGVDQAEVEWLDEDTIVINGQTLNLAKGETFGY